jgi:L-ascorbate metabolism protein UlaG (beta-lactamase superfamily)
MRITKFGHACLMIEEQEMRLLIDPSTFAKNLADVSDADAILITHDHFDHLDAGTVKDVLLRSPSATVYADPGASKVLDEAGVSVATVADGDEIDIKGVRVQVVGEHHDHVHPDLPIMGNVGFLIAGRFFYPGDALTVPNEPVEILAQPTDGPWLKLEQTLDYVRAIKPKVVIPVHEGTLAMPQMNYGPMEQFAKEAGATFHNLDHGKPVEF